MILFPAIQYSHFLTKIKSKAQDRAYSLPMARVLFEDWRKKARYF